MDAKGNVIHQQRERSVAGFRAAAAALPVIADLKKRIEAGEKGLDYEYLMARWDLGQVEYEEIKKVAAGLKKLTKEQRAKLAVVLVDAEVDYLGNSTRVRDQEAREAATRAAGPRLKEIMKSGHKLDENRTGMCWSVLMSYAELESDVELFAEGVAWYKKQYADEPRAARFLKSLDERLAEMKDEG